MTEPILTTDELRQYGREGFIGVRRAFATHFVAEGTWLFRADVQDTVFAD